jgi:Ser/Thr protein kinase RdoA (MazF antagonist)
MSDDLDAFMATMVSCARALPLERAVSIVREHYGFESRATRLTGERDENFRICAADGGEFVLKIAHPAEEPAVTDLATSALRSLEREDPSLPCPRVVRARGGEPHVRFTDESGAARTARLLTYLQGRPLGSADSSPGLRAACGQLGGRLTRALRSFMHPAAHRAIVWDVRHAAHYGGLLGQVPGFPCPAEARAVLERVVPRIESQLPSLRHQVVHNDLNPRNILVTSTGELSGVIDFGDMTYTAVIADVAVTAAELLSEDCTAASGAALSSIREVANAYHASMPLLPEERALLGTLVAARLVANLVVHEWHLHRNPAGDHYRPLDAAFILARLQIAAQLSTEETRL